MLRITAVRGCRAALQSASAARLAHSSHGSPACTPHGVRVRTAGVPGLAGRSLSTFRNLSTTAQEEEETAVEQLAADRVQTPEDPLAVVPAEVEVREVLGQGGPLPPRAAATAATAVAAPSSPWVPQDADKMRKMARLSLLHELWQKQQATHEVAVDWFLQSMPATYFRQTTEEARLEHLAAIATMIEPKFLAPEQKQEGSAAPGAGVEAGNNVMPTRDIILHFERNEGANKEVTFIQPGPRRKRNGVLSLLDSLPPADGTLHQVKVFPSRDGNLAINVFGYGSEEMEGDGGVVPQGNHGQGNVDASDLMEYAAALQRRDFFDNPRHPEPNSMFEPPALAEYISKCEPDYVTSSHPRRFCKQRVLYEEVRGTESVAADVEVYDGEAYSTAAAAYAAGGLAPTGRAAAVAAAAAAAAQAAAAAGSGTHWITLAMANVLPKVALSQCLRLLRAYDLDAHRCHLDVVADPGNGSVSMVRILVGPHGEGEEEGGSVERQESRWMEPGAWDPVLKDLRRLKWLDEWVLRLALDRHPGLGLERAEIINTLANLVYGALHKQNPWAYSKSSIYQMLDNPRYVKHAAAVADLFMARFDPEYPLPTEVLGERARQIKAALRRDVEADIAQGLLEKMVEAVEGTLRTNLYMPDRWALSLRVDPRMLMSEEEAQRKEVPFGAFFAHGRRFNGFHCRFRDIARGGMRIVTPGSSEQVAIEAGRQFDEAYGLAYAQQLKNKDIPEGGSKAVVLVDTTRSSGRGKHHAVRKGVKAFSDALLDVLVDTPETREYVVDFLGRQELLYLGPDEQVIPEDINWIVARAAQRGQPFPSAFMSSKPETGINHKEYGVTSEGVFVFLDEALRNAGIDPKQGASITVKITGGPDGDVAGNMIKIVHREYGDRVGIVGVADGTGSAEDPDGLSHEELLRLVEESLPISSFRFNKLGPRGVLYTCDTDEGIRARNTMHNRVKADAFVPAGGRPNTINKHNWRDFLGKDGKPSSPLIVEGANLFMNPEAREKLFSEAGVMIVKDSSANKCGVICSSFEIISSMLMDEAEFRDNKEAIVADVLERLRAIARREAALLFREWRNHPEVPLPLLSERVSHAINQVTDATLAALDSAAATAAAPPGEGEDGPGAAAAAAVRGHGAAEEHLDLLLPLVREHLPDKLVELAFDRVGSRLPPQYLRNAMASCLASHMVYTEGVHFVESQAPDRLGALAFDYIRSEGRIRGLADAIASAGDDDADLATLGPEQRQEVVRILHAAGVRASLGVY